VSLLEDAKLILEI